MDQMTARWRRFISNVRNRRLKILCEYVKTSKQRERVKSMRIELIPKWNVLSVNLRWCKHCIRSRKLKCFSQHGKNHMCYSSPCFPSFHRGRNPEICLFSGRWGPEGTSEATRTNALQQITDKNLSALKPATLVGKQYQCSSSFTLHFDKNKCSRHTLQQNTFTFQPVEQRFENKLKVFPPCRRKQLRGIKICGLKTYRFRI